MSSQPEITLSSERPFQPVAEFLASMRFLTRLPIPFAKTATPVSLSQAMRQFGLAGAVIGAVIGLALKAIGFFHMPLLMAAGFAVGFSLLVTGALHEDGLADTVDGLGGGKTRERRLEIMRDSRIGTYGAAALMLALMCRAGAYIDLLGMAYGQSILVLAACGAFSRAMVVDLLWATRSARSDGLSVHAGRPSRNTALFAIISAAAIAIWAGVDIAPMAGVEAIGVALLVTAGMRMLATKLIGGQTGDICGATQVLCELAMLATYLSTIH
jgi:adenosylcobinamide-GDP ribazoletransferase